MARKLALPAGMTPRLLSREAAARYVGLSSGAFAAEVAAGTFTSPFLLKRTRRRLWDVRALDADLDRAAALQRAANDIDAREGGRKGRRQKRKAPR
jgi:hypothetical protein